MMRRAEKTKRRAAAWRAETEQKGRGRFLRPFFARRGTAAAKGVKTAYVEMDTQIFDRRADGRVLLLCRKAVSDLAELQKERGRP